MSIKKDVHGENVAPKYGFINGANLDWADIGGNETYRTYVFPGGDKVTIKNPLYLNVSERHGARIFDAQGVSHYIPPTWIHLYWEVKPNTPNFVK